MGNREMSHYTTQAERDVVLAKLDKEVIRQERPLKVIVGDFTVYGPEVVTSTTDGQEFIIAHTIVRERFDGVSL